MEGEEVRGGRGGSRERSVESLKAKKLEEIGGWGGVSKRSKSYFQIILSVLGIIFN